MSAFLTEGPANAKAFAALLDALRAGGVMALVGAGSSARVGYPLWGKLLDLMAGAISESSPLAKASVDALATEADALWRAEEYRRLLGDDAYASFIRNTFGPEEARSDEFHVDLLRLPLRHVLTTNYDAVLEQAHAVAFPGSRAIAVSWAEDDNVRELIQHVGDAAYKRRYVYLHGRFDDPQTIVLTERDYAARYERQKDTWPKLFSLLATQRLVSVGFSLSDLDILAVFRGVKALMGPGEPRHFAILPLEGDDTGVARQRLRGKYGVEPVFYRQTPKHEGLHEAVRALRRAAQPSSPPPPPAPPPPSPTSLRPADEPLPPTAGYDPRCYARREPLERQVLSALRDAGTPIILLGPSRFGKTAVLRYVLSSALDADRAAGKLSRFAHVDLSELGPDAQTSFDDFAYALAACIVERVQGEDAWLEEAWRRPGGAVRRLTWLLEKRALPAVTGRLVLAIESSSQLPSFWESVCGVLRAWAQNRDAPWDRLRLALAVSTEPTLFKSEVSQSPLFNAATLVRLDDLRLPEIAQIARVYQLDWSDADLGALAERIGGHPYLIRLAMYEAALRGWTMSELLADADAPGGGIFYDFLRSARDGLGPALTAVLCDVLAKPTTRLDPDTEDRLRGAGVVRWLAGQGTGNGVYRFRYALYQRYFRGECARRR